MISLRRSGLTVSMSLPALTIPERRVFSFFTYPTL
jgi:hypothetical protein